MSAAPRSEVFRAFDLATGRQIYPTIIDAGLEAVRPLIEAELRKQIAKDILTVCACDEDDARNACNVAVTRAARVAAGGLRATYLGGDQ